VAALFARNVLVHGLPNLFHGVPGYVRFLVYRVTSCWVPSYSPFHFKDFTCALCIHSLIIRIIVVVLKSSVF
jgi:hypothetical protein